MAEATTPLVLVTGSSGYVASHCVKQLLEGGEYRVRGTVRSLKNSEVCDALKALVPESKFPLELVEADLLDEASWKKAVEGCTYVLHVASPFFVQRPKNVDELMKPAVDGTLNVLKACKEVGGVKRVVLTSSLAAIYVGNAGKVFDEEMWSDLKKGSPYEQSKTAAEKSAWDFVADLPEESKFELATINPGFIIGPLLLKKKCTSFDVVRQIMERDMPMVPGVGFLTVDVRDVAKAHIIAMTKPEAAGNRHLLSASEESYNFVFFAQCLANEFNPKGFNVPTKKAPKPLLWVLSWINKDVKEIYPAVGVTMKANINRMKNVLGIVPYKIEQSIVEMGHSMINLGMVKSPQETKGNTGATKTSEAVKEDKKESKVVAEEEKKESEKDDSVKQEEKDEEKEGNEEAQKGGEDEPQKGGEEEPQKGGEEEPQKGGEEEAQIGEDETKSEADKKDEEESKGGEAEESRVEEKEEKNDDAVNVEEKE